MNVDKSTYSASDSRVDQSHATVLMTFEVVISTEINLVGGLSWCHVHYDV